MSPRILLSLVALNMICSVRALDGPVVFGTQNEDCRLYLRPRNNTLTTNGSFTGESLDLVSEKALLCPPWYYRNSGHVNCKAGNDHSSVLLFQINTYQTYIQTFYCMTTSNETTEERKDVVGGCLFSFDMWQSSFYPLPCNISTLNGYMCAGLNRKGQLCGSCMKGFAPPIFSYTLTCVNCTDYYNHLNWLKYIGAAFGPLTIFCVLICFFHISATSPYLFGFVFYCQILSMPVVIRMWQNTHGYKEARSGTRFGEHVYVSLLSVWNLDILRAFYEPFCLHPNMSIVQALALDYLVALYPLILLFLAFTLVSLHSRNCRTVVLLWKPFRHTLRSCVRNLDIKTSLIESFSTLFYLSAMKIQSITLDLLSPTALYYPDGSISTQLYLYLAGDTEYFGDHHQLYGFLALFFFTLFTLCPAVLFFLYPCGFFQKFLNKINCNFLAMRVFMDAFQGHYKDGTGNTRDYRYFSGVFFTTRFAMMAIFILLNSLYSFLIFAVIVTVLALSVAILHPQKTHLHYTLDCTILLLLSIILFSTTGFILGPHNSIASQLSRWLGFISFALPLVYITCLACFWTVAKKRIPQRIVCSLVETFRCYKSPEEQRLID